MTYDERRRIKAEIDRASRDRNARGARLHVETPAGLPSSVEHGTANAYSNYGCRCDSCRSSERARQAARRAREKLAAA